MKERFRKSALKRGERRFSLSPRFTALIKAICLLSIIVLGAGCSGEKKTVANDEFVLLSIGDKSLTLTDVTDKIPVGLAPTDSVILFNEIIDSWLESNVIAEFAENKLPDMDRIERQVEAYRHRLVVMEYLRRMKESQPSAIDPDSVKAYYNLHKNEILTETPLIKGALLKVASSSPAIAEIRKLMTCGSEECIDQLEKTHLGEALQFDYFNSQWVDWPTVSAQIPYRFSDPEAFLKTHNNFEISHNGSTYFLHVSDMIPSGEEQPYEFASGWITTMMEQSKMAKYEDDLVASLINKAIKENRLATPGYDPLRHELKKSEFKQAQQKSKDEKK